MNTPCSPIRCIPLLLLLACGRPDTPKLPAPMPVFDNTAQQAATETLEQRQERGRYLVEIIGCGDCHSPKLMGPNGPYPDPERLLSGHPADAKLPSVPKDALKDWALFAMDNTAAVGPWGISFAANITSDASGIGAWSEEQFARAMREGKWKGIEGSRTLLPPMPWPNYTNMSAADVSAIYAYLISTPPVENVVPPPVPPDAM